MLFDLHVHTEHSPCSRLPLAVILDNARRLGLDGVCLTDHDTMAVGGHVREGVQDDGLCVIVGMEYATPEGDVLLFGPVEALPPGLSAAEALDAVAALGGAAVAAHPFRSWRPAGTGLLLHPGLCAVEVENGRNRPEENDAARMLARRRGLPGVGGSDAHALAELGRVPTAIDVVVRSRGDLVAALRSGRCRFEAASTVVGVPLPRTEVLPESGSATRCRPPDPF